MLWRLTLSVALFTNIFSHSEGCLFISFMVSFAVQKLLNALWGPEWEGSPKGRGECICMADSFCYTVMLL